MQLVLGSFAQRLQPPVYLTQLFYRFLARPCQAFMAQERSHRLQRASAHRICLNASRDPLRQGKGKTFGVNSVSLLLQRRERRHYEPQNRFRQADHINRM